MSPSELPSFRVATEADEEFLFAVYASTRMEEIAVLGWPEAQATMFLRMQFTAQTGAYRTQFPEAEHRIILLAGEPVGRILIADEGDALRLVDVALLSEHRGRGIGTVLLRELTDRADGRGLAVRLHVVETNPARRLYERFGFRPLDSDGLYLEMERPALGKD